MGVFGSIIFIFVFLLVIAFLGFSILLNGVLGLWYGFIRRFFGGSPTAYSDTARRYRGKGNSDSNQQQEQDGKIFSADEGTYVDFEEVE